MSVNQKVKVLHIFGGMNRGGAETLIMNVFRNIDSKKFQFDFVVHTDKTCDFDEEIVKLGGKILPLPSPNEVGFSNYARELTRTLQKYGPYDAIHSHVHHFSGFILKTAKRNKIPIRIAHSHSTMDGKNSSISRYVYRFLMRRMLSKYATDLVGCTSEANRSLYGSRIMKRTRLIKNGIDLSPFNLMDKIKLRRGLNLPSDALLLGHVGGFRETKNHFFLLRMFATFLSISPNTYLILVGDGSMRGQIEGWIKDLELQDRVMLLGVRSDIPQLMGAMDVLLLPSLYEGLPVVLVEAQAAGVPCVVANTVSKDAEVIPGMIDFVGLEEGPSVWGQMVNRAINKNIPEWQDRYDLLQAGGFEIKGVSNILGRIYKNEGL